MKKFFCACLIFTMQGFYSAQIKEGTYRGVLLLNEKNGTELPFNFSFTKNGGKPLVVIYNAEEEIRVDEVELKGDSLNFKMPVFDTEFRTQIKENLLEGVWINHYRQTENTIKFRATFNTPWRFPITKNYSPTRVNGRWECTFSESTPSEYKAVALFNQTLKSDHVSGTFLTETGDYRYLEGVCRNNKLQLSCFDGSHAFLFEGDIKDGKINGTFYSGAHWKEPWFAVKNETFELRDPNKITFVKEQSTEINFSLLSLSGAKVSLSDSKFSNRPVIIQLMGSWCPNCMDESVYLAGVYDRYQAQGLEIIALAFEKSENLIKVQEQVLRMKKRLKINYEVLLPLKAGKSKASELFPMLNEITAFPTTLFLNRKHQLVKIHTGFNGPATGKAYEAFQQETERLIERLLKE